VEAEVALTITSLSKTYPNGVKALKNLTLSIGNSMFGLVGPNGAGKSSLMRTVATLQDPDSGSITLDGIDVLRQKDQVRRILGYLPQEIRRRDTVQKRGHGEDYAGDPNSLTFTYSVKSTEDSSCCQKASNAAAGSTDLGPGRQQQLHDHDREQIRESSLSAVKGLSQ
jgi:ATPase subunit of ABC transporter with duplicated ATPase domains